LEILEIAAQTQASVLLGLSVRVVFASIRHTSALVLYHQTRNYVLAMILVLVLILRER
jgi:hypothetical protein